MTKDPPYDFQDFEYLYDLYAGAIYKIILNETDDRDAANLILEKTFDRLFSHITTFDASSPKLFTFLRQTAQYQIGEYLNTRN